MEKKIFGFIILAMLSLTASSAWAQGAGSNNVYIDQIGDGSSITVNQTGSGNTAGNSTQSMTFNGNNQTVSIAQIGDLNTHTVNIQGAGANITSTVTGSLNAVTISCGSGGAGPSGSCTDTSVTANATGDSNTLGATVGAKTSASIDVNGSHNTATIESSTTNMLGSSATITSTGDSNTIDISQSGPAGANGFNAQVTVTGSTNNIGVVQSGTVDSTVKINTTGSGNSISVHSGN